MYGICCVYTNSEGNAVWFRSFVLFFLPGTFRRECAARTRFVCAEKRCFLPVMVIAPLRQSIVSSIGVVRALTSERAASASVSGSLGRILCEDAAQSPTWATLASRAGGYQYQSHRSLVSVDVHGNKVDRALRQLRRKLIDEGVRETWLKQRVFVKVGQNQNLNTSSFVPYRMGSFLLLLALTLTLTLTRASRSFVRSRVTCGKRCWRRQSGGCGGRGSKRRCDGF